MQQSWIGWKIPLCKWRTFWMVPCLICYFMVILFKWLFMRNLATILPLKSKLSGKFQRFNAIDWSIAMRKNGWISNIVRHFTRPKQRTVLKKLFSLPQTGPLCPPPPDKTLLGLWNKHFLTKKICKYTDICFQSASRMRFLGVKKWCSANVISGTKQNHVSWKICQVRKGFGCIATAYCFQCQVSWDS